MAHLKNSFNCAGNGHGGRWHHNHSITFHGRRLLVPVRLDGDGLYRQRAEVHRLTQFLRR